jgi:hypothetical protein
MRELVIEVSPHVRRDGTKHPNAFDVRLADQCEVICTSDTPFFHAGRVLLERKFAQPDDVLVMSRTGSSAFALKGRIGLAASLTIEETRFGPKRRRYKQRPSLVGPSRIAQTPPTVLEPLRRETAFYVIPPKLRRVPS